MKRNQNGQMTSKLTGDEHSTRDQLVQKSFYDRDEYDERESPPEKNEERGFSG